ncbi:16S rRNA (cytidine(1402)-2'-O)-methyltransferase [Janibacter cremeus]|uniref:Ribosomal RNA small subunit methyltransferase I n=1 Tax=Janibacter cremeus TaxID=1285192 RepID=A0A852VQQ9_9MICO|nr:16S rRNA (cytidine(1402)-2'-O)-methyltransferase [Janibacter cremeus]NYF97780.1 16S rRNA (cytidine1402-2'-O)-methyltransferase [Janibacter cremeus]
MPLVLAATPIGDPRDASARFRDELVGADVVAAEDTRRLRRLAGQLGVELPGRVVSYHEHNEATRTVDLLQAVAKGERVVLVTDAGMPSVSDPGYRFVRACIDAEEHVTCVPGPSAVLVAVALSGLPVDRFCFEGFLPRKPGEKRRVLEELVHERRTMVFFEAPHRIAASLAAMAELFGADRQAAVCRELTKTYEEVRRGGLAELAEWAEEGVKGEITIVVGGAQEASVSLEDAVAEVLARHDRGTRLKDVCAAVATSTGHGKKALYDAVVAHRSLRERPERDHSD